MRNTRLLRPLLAAPVWIAAVLALSLPAAAQTAPSPSSAPATLPPAQMQQAMQAGMRATMEAMTASIGPMIAAGVEAQLAEAVRPETAERLATFKRNLYEALLRKGFTQQQAVEITVATPVPGPATAGR